jgi:peptidoglycan hydrolase-like protein with peptidoglycan-binding domain
MTTPATIAEGATGSTVRWAQYLLVRRTLSCEQIDGTFGPATRAAVEQFQRDAELTVDGTVGPATWTALHGDGPQPPTLATGSSGAVVEKLQTVLNEGRGGFAPASNPVLVIDGQYGPQTALAVQGIQTQAGLAPDGVVGLQTWAIPVRAAGATVADLCGVPAPGVGRPGTS